MKKITLLSLITICFLSAGAQVSALNETFDGSCASTNGLATNWILFNPIVGIDPAASWMCTATNGNHNTPGMECTGVYSSTYHLDTSYLVTPLLNVSGYDSVFLQFDTKSSNLNTDGTISILGKNDTLPVEDTSHYQDLSDSLNPSFGPGDATGWVTHQINLARYRSSPAFRIAFRYTSPLTSGNIWYLDNVGLTPYPLKTSQIDKKVLPLTIIGSCTTSQIALSYTAPMPGKYQLAIYDMMGRRVYDGSIMAHSGASSYVVNGLALYPGMYCVKMGNDNTYGTTRFMIQ
jgi:hypothetical protein